VTAAPERPSVVVTRPEGQAAPLIDALGRAGLRVIAIPGIAIEPVAIDAELVRQWNPDDFDWTIFTSANAVEHFPAPRGPWRSRVASVGRATARALAARGIRLDAVPAERFDTEGLLALPEFTAPAGERVLIVRGVGGRELLREELAGRGASVTLAEVYRRIGAAAPRSALAELQSALAADGAVITLATSAEVLEGLLGQLPPGTARALRSRPLVVPGARVAQAARALGWEGPLQQAPSADDAAMLAALRQILPG
jgi:uroporphyrinogen-III synthase